MKLGINASRARSGGGVAHLVGVLSNINPIDFDFTEVHVWSYPQLLELLPEKDWLIKHAPPELSRNLLGQLWWERFSLPNELRKMACDINLNVDAGSVCRFSPVVTMSRDMLSYEPGEIQRYGLSLERLRLIALRFVQNTSLKSADGVIFLTRYAAKMIQKSSGQLHNIAYVPHGVGSDFKVNDRLSYSQTLSKQPIKCLYISNALPYKHQWFVVEAIAHLREKGVDVELVLVGGGKGDAQKKLEVQIAESDPNGEFVIQHKFVPQNTLPKFLKEADIFIFASSCENMPNTLLEAMSANMPIACSNRGPMPEVLEDGGVYFDPEDVETIMVAILQLVQDPERSQQLAVRARQLSDQYSWSRCARETFHFLKETVNQNKLAMSK